MVRPERIAITVCMALVISLFLSRGYCGGAVSVRREQVAREYLERAEKQLDNHFNLRGKPLTADQRNMIAKRVIDRSKCGHQAADGDELLGVELIKELFSMSYPKLTPPFWVIAGLHHQIVSDQDAVQEGVRFVYVEKLRAIGTFPDVKAIVQYGNGVVAPGALGLYAEVCSIILQGVRLQSPVALKKLIAANHRGGEPVAELKRTLNLKRDDDLQSWFEAKAKKIVLRRNWTRQETLDAFTASAEALLPELEGTTLAERMAGLTQLDEKRSKVFVTEILRASVKAPLIMRPMIGGLAQKILKSDKPKLWQKAIIDCWKSLQAIEDSFSKMETRLKELDVSKRIILLQRAMSKNEGGPSRMEDSMNRALNRQTLPE